MGTVWHLTWCPFSRTPEVRRDFSKSLDLILYKEAANEVKLFAEKLKEVGCKVKWKLATRVLEGEEEYCPQTIHFTVRKIGYGQVPCSAKELYSLIASIVHSNPKFSLEAGGRSLKWLRFYDNPAEDPHVIRAFLMS